MSTSISVKTLLCSAMLTLASYAQASHGDLIEELRVMNSVLQIRQESPTKSLHILAQTYFEKLGCHTDDTIPRLCTNNSSSIHPVIASVKYSKRQDLRSDQHIHEVTFTLRPWISSTGPQEAFFHLRDDWQEDNYPLMTPKMDCVLSKLQRSSAEPGRNPLVISFITEQSLCSNKILAITYSVLGSNGDAEYTKSAR